MYRQKSNIKVKEIVKQLYANIYSAESGIPFDEPAST